jgi:hypothetical protein
VKSRAVAVFIDLHHKTVGIVELETFVVAARTGGERQAGCFHLGAHCCGIPAFQAEIEMVQRRHIRLLFDAEEAFADRQDVDGLGLLRQLHAEELLVEFGGLLQVGHPHRDMVEADGLEAGSGQGGGHGGGGGGQAYQGGGELAAAEYSAFEVGEHFFDDGLHGVPLGFVLVGKEHSPGNRPFPRSMR